MYSLLDVCGVIAVDASTIDADEAETVAYYKGQLIIPEPDFESDHPRDWHVLCRFAAVARLAEQLNLGFCAALFNPGHHASADHDQQAQGHKGNDIPDRSGGEEGEEQNKAECDAEDHIRLGRFHGESPKRVRCSSRGNKDLGYECQEIRALIKELNSQAVEGGRILIEPLTN